MLIDILDKRKLRKKILLTFLCSPVTLLPFMAGAAGIIISWTFGLGVLYIFAGLMGILLGAGIFVTRLLIGSENVARQALDELEKEAIDERNRKLDNLARRLRSDHDHRTTDLLRDLRTITEAFHSNSWSSSLKTLAALDILSTVEKLFSGCIRSLEKTLELWNMAQNMSEERREHVLGQREETIEEIGKSIQKLSDTLDRIRELSLGNSQEKDSELEQLRQELDTNLQIAQRVDEKMSKLKHDLEI